MWFKGQLYILINYYLKMAAHWRIDTKELMSLNCGAGEDSLKCKETKAVNPKGNQPWIVIGKTDAGAEAPILWTPDLKNQLIGKDPMLGKIEGRRRGGQQRIKVGWHHWLNGHEFEQTLGDSEGQGTLWAAVHGVAKSQTWLTDWLNINNLILAIKTCSVYLCT